MEKDTMEDAWRQRQHVSWRAVKRIVQRCLTSRIEIWGSGVDIASGKNKFRLKFRLKHAQISVGARTAPTFPFVFLLCGYRTT